MPTLRGYSVGLVVATACVFGLAGCKQAADTAANPQSVEFAARCSAALAIYYVKGGHGPEFDEKSKRQRYWAKRYHDLSLGSEARTNPMNVWNAAYGDLVKKIKGKRIPEKNEAMKRIMDTCAPHEV